MFVRGRDLSSLPTVSKDYLPVAFQCFFDGGNKADSRLYDTLTLAALSGDGVLWDVFTDQWRTVLKLHGAPFLHTNKAMVKEGVYRGWTEAQVESFVGDCVSVLEKHATTRAANTFTYLGIRPATVTVFLKDFKNALARIPDLGSVEEVCAVHAAAWCQTYGLLTGHSKAQFFYDQGEPFCGHIRDRMNNKKARKVIPLLGKTVVANEADMRGVPALQAADLFAWTINHIYRRAARFGWERRLLAIDRDEETFRYKRLISPNMGRLTVTRSWGLPKRARLK
jgi:hypothetical protein